MSYTKFLTQASLALLALPLMFAGADASKSTTSLSAAEIVEKNISARGGHAAWSAVQTLSMAGKMEAGTKSNVQLPFSLELKRGRNSHMQIQFTPQTSLHVYHGLNPWKTR